MLLKLLYFPIRFIHVFLVFIIASAQYLYARLSGDKNFDLGIFYQKNLERLGGTFIKVGQVLSVRYDILPEEECNALAKLQDNVKSFDAEKGIRIINQELGGIEHHGLILEPEPFAAGSLSQVYYARNRSGDLLAIKVKRPLIDAKMFADTIFLKLVKYVLLVFGIGIKTGAHKIIDELIEVLRNELDFKKEARHLELFYPISKKIKGLVVPKVYNNLSTKKVLTMDHLSGIPLSEYIARDGSPSNEEADQLCILIYSIYIQCIFGVGIFHADAHPGNIFILADGQIGIVDFGIVGVLNAKMRQKNFNYLSALSQGQTERAAGIFEDILVCNYNSNKEGLLRDTRIELDLYLKRLQDPDAGIAEKSSAELYMNSLAFARKYNYTFPENVLLFYKTLFTLDSILLKLYPAFDSKKQTAIILSELSAEKLLDQFSYDEVMIKLQQIPELISSIPELISLARSSLENNANRRNSSSNYLIHTLIRLLAFVLFFAAILFPVLYFFHIFDSLNLSTTAVLLISTGVILAGLRLKN